MKFKMGAIPEDKARGWSVFVDGKEVKPGMLELRSKFGVLTYGLRPEGYDAWVFREQGGGGVVTVPYAIAPNGDLLVGLLLEKRANMGDKPVWNAIGGFVEPDESPNEAQARETDEEVGLDSKKAWECSGLPSNPNRAFFVTDPVEDDGVHVYGLRLPFDSLEYDLDSGLKLKDVGLLPSFKKASQLRLYPWRKAIQRTPCGVARSAIAQLLAMIL